MDASIYQRPNKPRRVIKKQRTEAPSLALPDKNVVVEIDKRSECHVTPSNVARRMVSYLGEPVAAPVLEPSAGTGALLQALIDNGYLFEQLAAVEWHYELSQQLRTRFSNYGQLNLTHDCFLSYAARVAGAVSFSRVVMNPPFRKVKQHVNAALSLLQRSDESPARLVALVPSTYEHDDATTLETLPRDTFSAAKVSTKIIRFSV